jgi:acyl carrier protein
MHRSNAYLELIERCETKKDLLRVLDQLNIEATPADIVELKKTGVSPPPAAEWLDNAVHLLTSEDQTISTFRRQRISPWIDLYVAPKSEREKSLLIGFTGRNHKISCPVYSLLQTTPDKIFDVLILRDPLKANYLRGIQGHADSLTALLNYVQERFLDQYADTRVIGASGGGFAALAAGRYLQSRRTLAASGFLMTAGTASKRSEKEVAERAKLASRVFDQTSHHPPVRSVCLVPSRSEKDKVRGAKLATAFESKLVAVEDASDHDVFYELLKDAKLKGVLQKLFFSEDCAYDADQDIADGVIKPAWSSKFFQSRIDELEREIKSLKASASWRITAPLRQIRSLKHNFSRLTVGERNGPENRKRLLEPAIPSHRHGKVSRDGLQLSGPPVLSGTALERRIAQIFAEQFNVDVVGMTDDFFDLGGDSLAAEAMVTSINELTEYEFELADLFENSTPRKLAKLLAKTEAVK